MVFRIGLSPESYVLPADRFDPGADLFAFDDLVPRAIDDAEAIVDYRERGDWEELRRTAEGMIGFGERILRKLLDAQSKLDDSVEEVGRLTDSGAAGAPAPEDLDVDELVEHLQAQLGESVAAAIPDAEQLEEQLESGFRAPASFDVDPAESAGATLWTDVLDKQRAIGIWFVVAGYEELFRVDFFAAGEDASPESRPEAALESIGRRIQQYDDEIEDRFQRLYGTLAAADLDRLEASARRSVSYPFEVRDALRRLATDLRMARVERDRSDEWHAGNDVMAIGRLEAELHEVVWKATMLLAASYRYLFVARRRPGHPDVVAEVETACDTRFGSLVAEGEAVDLDDLLDDPDAYDGTVVETAGFVEDLRYDQDAPGSKFELVDVWNDRRVRAFVPYRNLQYWSIRDGAYVCLNGTFAAESEHADGDPEIELDVVSTAENAERSWQDHVARSLEAADVFDRYPSRINAYWSLESPDGAGETLLTDGGDSGDGSGGGGSGGGDSGGGSGGGAHLCPTPPIDSGDSDTDWFEDFEIDDGKLKYDLNDNVDLYVGADADIDWENRELEDYEVTGGVTVTW